MIKKNKRFISIIMIITLLLSIIFVFGGCTNDKVVAKGNGITITLDEFNKYFALYTYSLGYDENTWTIDMNGKTLLQVEQEKVLNELVNMKIIEKYEKEKNVEIDMEEVEKNYNEYVEMVNNNEKLKNYFENNDIEIEFIKNLMISDSYSIKFQEEVYNTIDFSDEILEKYYNDNIEKFNEVQVKASHILVKSEEKANDILDKINAGESFEELAKEHSICPSSSVGGDLGYFSKGMMVKEFEDAAFSMNVGDLSQPVKTSNGYHIIKLTDKKEDTKTFEEAKQYIINNLFNEAYNKKLEEISKDINVQKYMDKLPKNIKSINIEE